MKKKQLDNTTHITNIQSNNLHHQKRSLLIFEELDQLVSGFGLVNKNKVLIQPKPQITTFFISIKRFYNYWIYKTRVELSKSSTLI
jgi:hypothetical protein